MALLCVSSLLGARYPFCLLNVRRLVTEAGQVYFKSFSVCMVSIFAQLRRTGLYDFHLENGAKMVPFAGYSMPLSYADVGQSEEQAIMVFETSPQSSQSSATTMYGATPAFLMSAIWSNQSMVATLHQLFECSIRPYSFRGKTATEFLEWLTPSSLSVLGPYSSTLSVILNEDGGIIDDTVITKHASDAFYVVTNASRRDRDLTWFKQKLEEWNASEKGKNGRVEMEVLENWGLLALQGSTMSLVMNCGSVKFFHSAGPKAAPYLQTLTSYDLRGLTFGKSAFVPIEGFNLHVARGGYTGEDGFEVKRSIK